MCRRCFTFAPGSLENCNTIMGRYGWTILYCLSKLHLCTDGVPYVTVVLSFERWWVQGVSRPRKLTPKQTKYVKIGLFFERRGYPRWCVHEYAYQTDFFDVFGMSGPLGWVTLLRYLKPAVSNPSRVLGG